MAWSPSEENLDELRLETAAREGQKTRAHGNLQERAGFGRFRRGPEGYFGFGEGLPGATTQGATLEEARLNLRDAVSLVLEANRELALEAAGGGEIIREPLKIGA